MLKYLTIITIPACGNRHDKSCEQDSALLLRSACYKSAKYLIDNGFNIKGKNLVVPYTVDNIKLVDLLKENGANVRLERPEDFLFNFDFEYKEKFDAVLAATTNYKITDFEYYYDDIFGFIFTKINNGYIILCMLNENNEIINISTDPNAIKISKLYNMPILQEINL